jgi:predicted transcriptional regulator of viral defense system
VPDLIRAYREQPPEAAIRALANTQFGRLSVQQLEDLGVSKDAIYRRVKSGRWRRAHHGVIVVGHDVADYRARCWEAQLAYGPDAVISHLSAGALWEVVNYSGTVHLALPHRRRSRRGTKAHESRTLTDEDVRIHHGLRVTNPARTLVDLADLLTRTNLERALSEAHRHGYIDRHALPPHQPGRRGFAALDRQMTRSQLERSFLSAIRRAGDLPLPETNVRLHGFEADAYWPAATLVAEIDHYATHGDRLTFERDRVKQTTYALHGILTVRITAQTLPTAPATIRELISDRSGRITRE